MFRAVYRQVARFLNWVNRTGSGSSASRASRDAENHRRDVESRHGDVYRGDRSYGDFGDLD
jgi:hypothetical protein